jgi:hypothetical protein
MQPADASRQAMAELLRSLNPHDPAEAQLAVLAIGAAQASMDSFARAARPDVTDETVIRLRSSALAPARTYASTLRMLRKQPKPAEQEAAKPAPTQRAAKATPPEPPPAAPAVVPPGYVALMPGAEPIPAIEVFQPRDRFGEPIPHHRTDLMSRAQVRAMLAYPRDPALEAAAIAEEAEAMRAEQQEMSGTPPAPSYPATTFATSSGPCRTSAS